MSKPRPEVFSCSHPHHPGQRPFRKSRRRLRQRRFSAFAGDRENGRPLAKPQGPRKGHPLRIGIGRHHHAELLQRLELVPYLHEGPDAGYRGPVPAPRRGRGPDDHLAPHHARGLLRPQDALHLRTLFLRQRFEKCPPISLHPLSGSLAVVPEWGRQGRLRLPERALRLPRRRQAVPAGAAVLHPLLLQIPDHPARLRRNHDRVRRDVLPLLHDDRREGVPHLHDPPVEHHPARRILQRTFSRLHESAGPALRIHNLVGVRIGQHRGRPFFPLRTSGGPPNPEGLQAGPPQPVRPGARGTGRGHERPFSLGLYRRYVRLSPEPRRLRAPVRPYGQDEDLPAQPASLCGVPHHFFPRHRDNVSGHVLYPLLPRQALLSGHPLHVAADRRPFFLDPAEALREPGPIRQLQPPAGTERPLSRAQPTGRTDGAVQPLLPGADPQRQRQACRKDGEKPFLHHARHRPFQRIQRHVGAPGGGPGTCVRGPGHPGLPEGTGRRRTLRGGGVQHRSGRGGPVHRKHRRGTDPQELRGPLLLSRRGQDPDGLAGSFPVPPRGDAGLPDPARRRGPLSGEKQWAKPRGSGSAPPLPCPPETLAAPSADDGSIRPHAAEEGPER